MNGPRVFKVPTDRAAAVPPPVLAKDWADTTVVIFDFSKWLGDDEQLTGLSGLFIQVNPDVNAGVWFPYPNCCCPSAEPPPEDVNPLALSTITILPDHKRVQFGLAAGTPNLAYLASFVASAGPVPRAKEVGVIMSCYATHAFPVPLPPPVPGTPIIVIGSEYLPEGAVGSININNGSAGPITIWMPPNPVLDQTLRFKDVAGNAGTWPITIGALPGTTIDGMASYTLLSDFMSLELYWTGVNSNWGTR